MENWESLPSLGSLSIIIYLWTKTFVTQFLVCKMWEVDPWGRNELYLYPDFKPPDHTAGIIKTLLRQII